MTIKCKKIQVLSSLKEIKDEQKTLDDKCVLVEVYENDCVELSEEVKMSVLDLYHIGKTRVKARQEARFDEEMRKMLLENGIIISSEKRESEEKWKLLKTIKRR